MGTGGPCALTAPTMQVMHTIPSPPIGGEIWRLSPFSVLSCLTRLRPRPAKSTQISLTVRCYAISMEQIFVRTMQTTQSIHSIDKEFKAGRAEICPSKSAMLWCASPVTRSLKIEQQIEFRSPSSVITF